LACSKGSYGESGGWDLPVNKSMQKSLSISNFNENETIASIGASSGVWEIWFASQVENLTFYLQDIDPLNCNQEEIDYGVKYYEKLLQKTISGKFIPIIGTQSGTNLPQNIFDKVLIINSLHEFKKPDIILQDIFKILKSDGQLFIEEQIAKFSGEIHEGCGNRLFTENELVVLSEKCGFELIEKHLKDDGVMIFEICTALQTSRKFFHFREVVSGVCRLN
jgi:ubiquinone/menaquinone biosynthesis C-methylase UbiE